MDRPSDLRELDEGDLASHALFLRRLAKRLVRDEASAEDVAQETWRAALAQPPREVVSWRAWLTAAARNVARQMARGGARRAAHEPAAAAREGLPSTDEVAARLEAERRLIDAVAALPDDDRVLILLRHFDGLPPRAIARRMQAPVETVKTRLKRALERLRARLVERGGDPRRLHSGLLLVANGLLGKVGATGGVAAGALAMSVKSKVVVAVVAAAVVVVAVQVGRGRLLAGSSDGAGGRDGADIVFATKSPTSDDEAAAIDASRAAEIREGTTRDVRAPLESEDDSTIVTGRVVDLDRKPIEGVEICSDLQPRDWPPQRIHADSWPSTRTDADGRFVWRRPSVKAPPDARAAWAQAAPYSGWADALVVSGDAWKPGFVPGHFVVNGVIGSSQEAADLVLVPEARIAGQVDVAAGEDASAATVVLEELGGFAPAAIATLQPLTTFARRTHCDDDGRFELGGLKFGKYRLWASLPGSRNTPSSVVQLASGQVSSDVVLKVEWPPDDGSTFRVRVLAPDDEPVEGASIGISYREPNRSSVLDFVTDAKGEVVVPTYGLPIQFVLATAPHEEWLPTRRRFDGRPTEECELQFKEPMRLSLHVRSADETPLEEVIVTGKQWLTDADRIAENWSTVGRRTTDLDGRIELRLLAGMVELDVHSDGFVDGKVGPLKLAEGIAPIEVALTPAPAFLGRVTYAGHPVAGALVSASQPGNPGRVCSVHGTPSRAFRTGVSTKRLTGSDGRFRMCWPYEGTIFLHASAPGFATADLGPFDAGVSPSASGLEFELTRGGSIAGSVVPGRDGTRATVVVLSCGDGFPRSWPIAANGGFRADNLTPGPWNVRVHGAPLEFISTSVTSDVGPLDVLPSNCVVRDGETTTLTLSSDDMLDCIVHGEVTGLRDATTPTWLNWWQAWIGPSDRTDERIAWNEQGYDPSVPFEGDHFDFRRDWCAGSDLVLALRLDPLDHSNVVTLRQPWKLQQGIAHWSGKFELGGIEGCVVSRAPESLHVEADATTADGVRFHARVRVRDDGGFTIPRAPAGAVRVRVEGLAAEQTVQVEAGATTNVTLR